MSRSTFRWYLGCIFLVGSFFAGTLAGTEFWPNIDWHSTAIYFVIFAAGALLTLGVCIVDTDGGSLEVE